jgi:hypothetical protein
MEFLKVIIIVALAIILLPVALFVLGCLAKLILGTGAGILGILLLVVAVVYVVLWITEL